MSEPANNIKKYRKAHGMSQAELAKRVDSTLTQGAISQWENGTPPKARLARLAEVLEVTEAQLMGEDAAPQPTAEQAPVAPMVTAPGLTDAEKHLLDCFRGTDEGGQRVILSVAGLEYQRRRDELLKG